MPQRRLSLNYVNYCLDVFLVDRLASRQFRNLRDQPPTIPQHEKTSSAVVRSPLPCRQQGTDGITAAATTAPQLRNISTRCFVQTGDKRDRASNWI
jgi:hypothetical protein